MISFTKKVVLIFLLYIIITCSFGAILRVYITNTISLNFYFHCKKPEKIKKYLKTHLKNIKSIGYSRISNNLCNFYIYLNNSPKNFTYNVSPFLHLSNNVTYVVMKDFWINIVKENPKPGKLTKNKINIIYNIDIISSILLILFLFLQFVFAFLFYLIVKSKYNENFDYKEKIKYRKFVGRISVIFWILWIILLILFIVLDGLDLCLYIFGSYGIILFMLNIIFSAVLYIVMITRFILNMEYKGKIRHRRTLIYTVVNFLYLFIIIIFVELLLYFVPSSLFNNNILVFILFFLSIFCFTLIFQDIILYNILFKILGAVYPANSEILQIVDEISKKIGVKKPDRVFILKYNIIPNMNAMIVGLFKKRLYISEGLLNILNKDELKSVIAHELAHKKYKHIEKNVIIGFVVAFVIGFILLNIFGYIGSNYIMVSNNLMFTIFFVLFAIFMVFEILIINKKIRKSELEADLAAARITNPKTYIKALTKIAIANYIPLSEKEFFATHPNFLNRFLNIGKAFGISMEEINEIIMNVIMEMNRHLY